MTEKDYNKMSEEEKKNYKDGKGYIYMIRNKINGHMYIGLTSLTPSLRFEQHVKNSRKEEAEYVHLYAAFKKHGIKNFELTTLGCYDIFDLPEKEKEFIRLYNTYENKEHYNETLGGESQYAQYDEKVVVETYKKLGTIAAVEKELEICDKVITKILKRNRIKIKSNIQHQKDNAYDVYIYDKNHHFIKKINTSMDAAQWFLETYPERTKTTNLDSIRKAIFKGMQERRMCYGLYFENKEVPIKIKKEKIDKSIELYENNEKIKTFDCIDELATYINTELFENKRKIKNIKRSIFNSFKTDNQYRNFSLKSQYYENIYKEEYEKYQLSIKNNDILPKRKKKRKTNVKENKCSICGQKIHRNAKLCLTCSKKEKSSHIPPREIIKKLIREKSFSEIGKMYNVDGNTIKRWCKHHKLPSHKALINLISDIDWKNENWDILKDNNKKKKIFNPSYEQLKKDVYELSKKGLSKKYDTDKSVINKKLIEYNIPHDSQLIIKFSPEEWEDEKWNNVDFIEHIKTERIKYNYPERTKLKELIRQYNFIEIGNMYNLDESIIRRLLKQFNLPYHRSEINEYSDEEWDKL